MFLAERLGLDLFGHAVLEAEAFLAQVLDHVGVNLLVHLERISSADHAFLLCSQNVQQGFKLGPVFLSEKSSFCVNALVWVQSHQLPLLGFVAHDLFLHSSIRVARAHLDNFAGEVDRQAKADGGFELQALLARDASPLTALWPSLLIASLHTGLLHCQIGDEPRSIQQSRSE